MALVRTLRDQFDWPLFFTVSTIALFGVVNLYSATSQHPNLAMTIPFLP